MAAGSNEVETLTLRPPRNASSSFEGWSIHLRGWVDDGCALEEVGSTGVPGLPTKGDLDVVVVAPDAKAWHEAVGTLAQHLQLHEPQHWTETWASFRGVIDAGEAGVQVVLVGCGEDVVLRGFRALLLSDAAVVARYISLKEQYNGHSMQVYRAAKGRFVVDELRAQSST